MAWEVLEVAKKIFTARGDTGKELLSQTLILLGEVGMESENFADAVVDIKAGLELQESLYEKTNRKIAETQYKLGIAQSSISSFDDAIKSFEKSIETLSARIDMLKKKDKEDEGSKKEIEEMEELIPEIKEKINDMISVKDEVSKKKKDFIFVYLTKQYSYVFIFLSLSCVTNLKKKYTNHFNIIQFLEQVTLDYHD